MGNVIEDMSEKYGFDRWGNGYFRVSPEGTVTICPIDGVSRGADLFEVVQELAARGFTTPLLLRFPQVVASQVRRLREAFCSAINEFDFEGKHTAVYPMKVNQRRSVLEAYLSEAREFGFGLEVGSKSELYAAAAVAPARECPIIINGFKDREFVELAFLAAEADKRPTLVIEKLNELTFFLERVEQAPRPPDLGIRVKLYSRGSGRWERSGGEQAKFGLTSTEVLEVIQQLKRSGRIEHLKLLHFHIGSQITDIKRIKHAVREAARVYAKIWQLGVPIEYLDVGGGMAVDYDGSRSSFASSANYSLQEFANDVIYQTLTVANEENVPHPTIITESGRVLVAHHAVFVTNVQGEIETVVEEVTPLSIGADDPQLVEELGDLNSAINSKNFHEFYHDALELRDQLFTMFDLGMIDLEQRAKGEVLFWDICEKVDDFAAEAGPRYAGNEFENLRSLLRSKYLANFSVFSTLPDHWGMGQLFPVAPIHRLDTPTTGFATLCDVTCDSDGVVEKFIDTHHAKDVLEVHELDPERPYYLAMFLVGAYQEVLGSQHNLLGAPHEATVMVGSKGTVVRDVVAGGTIADSLNWTRYGGEELQRAFADDIELQVKQGQISPRRKEQILGIYAEKLKSYGYLCHPAAQARQPPPDSEPG